MIKSSASGNSIYLNTFDMFWQHELKETFQTLTIDFYHNVSVYFADVCRPK